MAALASGTPGIAPTLAGAATPDFFTRFGATGDGAGQMQKTRGIVADPTSGHVFLADELNNRVDEFTAWGEFVKAWGWGVRDGGSELQICTESTKCRQGLPGDGGGQLNRPIGITLDQSGDIYVFEDSNLRVQKFSADGDFLRAFGGDVVAQGPDNSPSNEVQEIELAATGGTFTLSFSGPFGGGGVKQTPALSFDASASAVESALNALPTVAENGGSVSVSGGPGDATGSAPYLVTFEGDFAGNNMPQLSIDRSNLGPFAVGARLICSTSTEAAKIEYSWLRNGAAIPGATSFSYTTTAADEGKTIQCQVAAIGGKSGATQTAVPSFAVPPGLTSAAPIPPSTIAAPSGDFLSVGKAEAKMTCSPQSSGWKNAVSFSYSWYWNGKVVPGATEATYLVSEEELSAPGALQCAVTATGSGGLSTTLVSQNALTFPTPNAYFTIEATASTDPVRTVSQGGGAEICVPDSGDLCKAGVRGSGEGEFGMTQMGGGTFRNYIGAGPQGTIYVADRNRIETFTSDGFFKAQLPLPEEGNPGALAVDPVSGDLYFSYFSASFVSSLFAGSSPVFRLNSTTGEVIDVLKVTEPAAIGVDAHGNVYVYGDKEEEIFSFAPDGEPTGSFGQDKEASFSSAPTVSGIATNVVTDSGGTDIYLGRAYEVPGGLDGVRVYGVPPGRWAPPVVPPEVTAEYATAVGSSDATVKAEINPRFWSDTKYYVQYGKAPCSSGGCTDLPTAPGTLLTSKITDTPVKTPSVLFQGLAPGTTYYYRFVAESGGGGPVFGQDHFFTTFLPQRAGGQSCPNEIFRAGSASTLEDCRAYEMVSPLDKNNGDIRPIAQITNYSTGLSQAAKSGDALTYSSYRAFGNVKASPYVSQYLARRTSDGWKSEALGPLRDGPSFFTTNLSLENEFRAFSSDLSTGWLLHDAEPILDSIAAKGFPGLYRRDNGSGDFEALSGVTPPQREAWEFNPDLQGFSADGRKALFTVNDQLTPEGSTAGNYQVYLSSGNGQLHLVSVLPNGLPTVENSTGGGPNQGGHVGRFFSVHNAISADGSRVYWTEEDSNSAGKIYLRSNPDQEQSAVAAGKCTEPEKACTLPVSQTVSPLAAHFETASSDGSKAIFKFEEGSREGDLYEFDAEKRKSTLVAHKVRKGLIGASADASRLYFASDEVLTGPNAQGKAPALKSPNLYFFDASKNGADRYRFIGTLTNQDVSVEGSSLELSPFYHTGRVNPSGQAALFLSNASLTGYDNTDVNNGKADAEVYLYDVTGNQGEGLLRCVSCNPSGVRPTGRDLFKEPPPGGATIDFQAAAMVPTGQTQLYSSRAISDDGRRVFFTSFDSLALGDTNGKADVYQWEAVGSGSCEEDDPSFSTLNGGCVSLISSGESASDSEFVDMSSSGDDVFFTTLSSLVPQDYGLIDVYDAKIGGGFPSPSARSAECEGEACQGPLAPPNDPTPASSSFEGSGNVKKAQIKKPQRKRKAHRKKAHRKTRGHQARTGRGGQRGVGR